MSKKVESGAYDVTDIVTVSIYVNSRITLKEEALLYRTIWKLFEDLCIPPVGIRIDYEPDIMLVKERME